MIFTYSSTIEFSSVPHLKLCKSSDNEYWLLENGWNDGLSSLSGPQSDIAFVSKYLTPGLDFWLQLYFSMWHMYHLDRMGYICSSFSDPFVEKQVMAMIESLSCPKYIWQMSYMQIELQSCSKNHTFQSFIIQFWYAQNLLIMKCLTCYVTIPALAIVLLLTFHDVDGCCRLMR